MNVICVPCALLFGLYPGACAPLNALSVLPFTSVEDFAAGTLCRVKHGHQLPIHFVLVTGGERGRKNALKASDP